ncbi:MAG: efflux RND transporter periplasmic adaptor subunit [Bacteroidaceae bacterium]|nr:efflux RND transporter periplasmic adaptor subunit [Bacteroidaceae bacterium]
MDKLIEQPRGISRMKKYWPWAAAAGLLLIALGWIIFGNHDSTLRVAADGLTVSEVQQAEFKDYVRLSGQVVPIQVVQLSPEEGGIVTERVAEEGAMVRRGDVIVRLRNSNLDLQILNAEAELAEKQNLLRNTQVAMQQDRLNNQLEQAQLAMDTERKLRSYRQQERLYAEKLVSRETFLQAEEDYRLAQRKQGLISQRLLQDSIYRSVQMDQMEDNLSNMRTNVVLVRERKNKLEVCAPIDGELGLLDVELGQSIAAGQKIGQINDLSDYKIEAQVDEHYIDRVRAGLSASLNRNGKDYSLAVRKVYPEVRQGKFRTDFVFRSAKPENIRTGQTCYLNLELGQPEQAVLIPRGTFFQTTGGAWIFVLSRDGRIAYRRKIKIGRQNPQFYEVTEGLEPGERVITSGYEGFGDNERLEIK